MGRARRAPSRIVSIPSSDATFAQVVKSILQRGTIGTEHDLETALHPLYPLATVRGRELSGERFATWYVYRDRTFRPPRDRSWWLSSVTARLELAAADGRILDADDAAATLLGRPVDDVVGRTFLELVDPLGRESAAVIWSRLRDVGVAETVLAISRPGGRQVLVEGRGERRDDRVEVRFREIAQPGSAREAPPT